MLKLIIIVQLLYVSAITASSTKMKVVYEWGAGEMDLEFPSQEFRNESIRNGTLIPEQFFINGLAVHKHRIFITFPWSLRNSATVAYLNLKESSTMSPKFIPYPSWEAYLPDERGQRRIGQVFRARVDRCDRLWLLEKVSDNDRLRIIVLDLNTDTIIRSYPFPDALHFKVFYHWIVVEDGDCENTFAYVNDASLGGFWTYSWAENDSWHTDGYQNIYAMILAPNCDDAFSTLYYQMYSNTNFHESFFVSTKHLRDNQTALSTVPLSYQKSEAVHLRAAIFDPATNILYGSDYPSSKDLHLTLCWNKKNYCPVNAISELTISVDSIDSNPVFGDDMTVDEQGNLWIEAVRGPKTALFKFSPPFDMCTCGVLKHTEI